MKLAKSLVLALTPFYFIWANLGRPSEFIIASYNVENLFKTIPQYEKSIHSFNVVDWKIKNLLQGLSPALKSLRILALQEVSGVEVLYKISKKIPNSKIIMSAHKDSRGMGVGVIYREGENFKLESFNDIETRKGRSILHVRFLVSGQKLHLFNVHFPSQFNGFKWRVSVIKKLSQIIQNLPKKEMVIVIGDFNLTALEQAEILPIRRLRLIKNESGNYFYIKKMQWENLDRLMLSYHFSRNIKGPLRSIGRRVEVAKSKICMKSYFYPKSSHFYGNIIHRVPKKFDPKTRTGCSDHFPIFYRMLLVP